MLYGVAYVSPMLGLLGTVWGMIEAFQAAALQGLGQAEKLAEGIYNALVTTFAGLMIAIPVLIFYFYFQSKIESIIAEMNDVSIRILEHMFDQHQLDHPIKTTPQGHSHVPHEPVTTSTAAQED
jgi:biopolymer transport protein ExbB